MGLAHTLATVLRQGLPFPQDGTLDAQQRAWLVYLIAELHVRIVGQPLLDFSTPLDSLPLDVRGNAQHWMIRTAEAAKSSTESRWEERFEAQEAWDDIYVGRMVPAWQSYLKNTGATRRGLSMATVKRKHAVKASTSYEKARTNWTYAFREEAEAFYEVLAARTQTFADSTQGWLSAVGLHLRDFVGAFSLHIMALCSNPQILGLFGHRERVVAVSMPDPPIISIGLRPALNQELMAVFGRDLFLSLPHPDVEAINLKLAFILESFMHPAYARPPVSFLRVEAREGGHFLHTRILEDLTPRLPRVVDWQVPWQRHGALPAVVVLVPDVLLYVEAGDYPLAFGVFTLSTRNVSLGLRILFLHRSDGLGTDVPIDPLFPHTVAAPALPDGVTWQIVWKPSSTLQPIASDQLGGTFTWTDTVGLTSTRASWRIQGIAPIARRFVAGIAAPSPISFLTVVLADVFSKGLAGSTPIVQGHIKLSLVINNLAAMQLILHPTQVGIDEIILTTLRGVVVDIAVLLPGERWELQVYGPRLAPLDFPIFFSGEWWFTDAASLDSNHELWAITVQA
jgi:hypothetical protein